LVCKNRKRVVDWLARQQPSVSLTSSCQGNTRADTSQFLWTDYLSMVMHGDALPTSFCFQHYWMKQLFCNYCQQKYYCNYLFSPTGLINDLFRRCNTIAIVISEGLEGTRKQVTIGRGRSPTRDSRGDGRRRSISPIRKILLESGEDTL
jgi:hypothetical protein